ncbi:MAG: pyridoxal phosphate-dependent aminotransferase [Bacteroidales bacterium]|nr:pyridoxal phosphate-dependent aminotransferase [Bacteroidales bacterium]
MDCFFDEIVPRRGTSCVKWDAAPPVKVDGDVIPLWVADMDFRVAPCIAEALEKRVKHGVFGYVNVPRSWYECVSRWFSQRHGWDFDPSSLMYTTGVVPALSAVIKALAKPGDRVVIATPVYNCFFSSIRNNGCIASESPLKELPGPRYALDFDDLERRCSDPSASILLLCNPHNPAGRVWTRAELERVASIARRTGMLVVSDEIHCEIVRPGLHYVPMGAVDPENTVSLISPSKSFNIAGLQMAGIVSGNPERRAAIDRAVNINEICDVNPFGPVAAEAAYSAEGAAWLDALNAYIWENDALLRSRFARELPEFPVFELEGTYLVWIDCRSAGMPSAEIENFLLSTEKVWVNAGSLYGAEGFVRVNLATSRQLLSEGLDRLVRGLRAL